MYPNAEGTGILLGVVWPDNNVGFPDYFKESAKQWWSDEFVRFHDRVRESISDR